MLKTGDMNGQIKDDHTLDVEQAFDQFFTALTCKSILSSFHQLLDVTGLRHADHRNFYTRLKEQLRNSWKAQALWAKLDKRASHRDYGHGRACADTKVSRNAASKIIQFQILALTSV